MRAQGDSSGAAEIRLRRRRPGVALGIEEPSDHAASRAGDPTHLGLAVPLSGKFQPVGEAAMRAAMLATGTPAAGRVQLGVRDAARRRAGGAQQVDGLGARRIVIGIVAALARAGRRRRATNRSRHRARRCPDAGDGRRRAPGRPFICCTRPRARAAELRAGRLALGARDFALVGPDSAAATRLRDAFRQSVVEGGGRVTADVSYPPGATSFTAVVAALKKSRHRWCSSATAPIDSS